MGRVVRQDNIAAECWKGSNMNLYTIDEDENENVEDTAEDEGRSAGMVLVGREMRVSSGKR